MRYRIALAIVAVVALLGCNGKPSGSAPSASASTTLAPTPSGAPVYTGPTGTVKGVIRVVGDEPPHTPFSYPEGCEAASGVYGKLFRKGPGGELADALVAVTDYGSWKIPVKDKAVKLTIQNCAFSTRTLALTGDQHIEVENKQPEGVFNLFLDGAKSSPVTLTVIPRGPPVTVRSLGHGRYWLRDHYGKEFMVVHVFDLPYSTAAVTGLNGRYEISGVPVGKARLSAMLPQTRVRLVNNVPMMLMKGEEIEVKEGDNVHDLELEFVAARDTPPDGHGGTKPGPIPTAATSGSASPSTSAAPSAAPSATPAPSSR